MKYAYGPYSSERPLHTQRTVHAHTTEPYLPAHRSERISSVPRFSSRHCSRSMSESLSSSCCCFSSLSFFACFLLAFSACLSAYSSGGQSYYQIMSQNHCRPKSCYRLRKKQKKTSSLRLYIPCLEKKSLHFFLNNFNKFKLTFTIFGTCYHNDTLYEKHPKLIFKIYFSLSIVYSIVTSSKMTLLQKDDI